MKFGKRSIEILNKFASINDSIIFKQGYLQSIIDSKKGANTSGRLYVEAILMEEIPQEMGIYQLKEFLQSLTLFDDEEYDINIIGNYLNIKSKNKTINYMLSDPKVLVGSPTIKIPDIDIELNVLKNDLISLIKSMTILSLNELILTGIDGNIYIGALNINNPSTNKFLIQIGNTQQNFYIAADAELLKNNIIIDDYKILLSKKGLGIFESSDMKYIFPFNAKNCKFNISDDEMKTTSQYEQIKSLMKE